MCSVADMEYKFKPLPGSLSTGFWLSRFWHTLRTHSVAQVTTGLTSDPTLSNQDTNKNDLKSVTANVISDLHCFSFLSREISTPEHLFLCLPRESLHCNNIATTHSCGLMVGHTDPQLFHWFRQIGTYPPRSLLTVKAVKVTHVPFSAPGRASQEANLFSAIRGVYRLQCAPTCIDQGNTNTEDWSDAIHSMGLCVYELYALNASFIDAAAKVHEIPNTHPLPMDPLALYSSELLRVLFKCRSCIINYMNSERSQHNLDGFVFALDSGGLYLMTKTAATTWEEVYFPFKHKLTSRSAFMGWLEKVKDFKT